MSNFNKWVSVVLIIAGVAWASAITPSAGVALNSGSKLTSLTSVVVSSTNAMVSSGAVTTPAIDTTGANFIGVYTWTTFNSGVLSDSKSNTWTELGIPLITHNTIGHLYSCTAPCVVGSGHTFSLANNGTGFNQGMIAFALNGVVYSAGDSRDTNANTGNKLMLVNNNDPPPHTIAVATGWKPTAATVFMLAGCGTEQGAGGASAIDQGMTSLDHTPGLALFYKMISASGVNFLPTCTTPNDALHQGASLLALSH
jgi:hypothetical protein